VGAPIDWAAAVRTGQRLAPTGPSIGGADAARVVSDLRTFSARAELAVRETTGLGQGLPVDDADVVDRPGWVKATAEGMELLAAPLVEKLAASTGKQAGALTKGVAGSQVGAILGFLSGKVLGQFDPLGGDPARPGRLLLVAPNIVKVERELHANPTDFRLWVCLHESTHRLQFTAVPWLRDHFKGLVREFAEKSDTDPAQMLRRAVDAIKGGGLSIGGRPIGRRVADQADTRNGAVTSVHAPTPAGSWIEGIQSPEQRAVFDQLMALMTVLEGHADYVMDAVGPTVVPSVAAIRTSFTERRQRTKGPIERLLRALLGMDMKLAQYIKGGAFVGGVVDLVGMDGFNAVWSSAATLPTRREITDPAAWVRRVHG
jgi:coenzyme F420 biosynthesis associated uncharacterized protein